MQNGIQKRNDENQRKNYEMLCLRRQHLLISKNGNKTVMHRIELICLMHTNHPHTHFEWIKTKKTPYHKTRSVLHTCATIIDVIVAIGYDVICVYNTADFKDFWKIKVE